MILGFVLDGGISLIGIGIAVLALLIFWPQISKLFAGVKTKIDESGAKAQLLEGIQHSDILARFDKYTSEVKNVIGFIDIKFASARIEDEVNEEDQPAVKEAFDVILIALAKARFTPEK